MPRFLDTRGKSNLAIACCARCSFKLANADLRRDPETGLRVCEACVDARDPWKLPPRAPDRIALAFAQPDQSLVRADRHDFSGEFNDEYDNSSDLVVRPYEPDTAFTSDFDFEAFDARKGREPSGKA